MTTVSSAVPPEADRECGLLTYSSPGPRLEGSLRRGFSDFQVEEIIALPEISEKKEPGLVPIYKVTKAGIDTLHVAKELSASIKSEVNFAGLKDKNATVVQYVSARSTRASSPTVVEGDRFQARLLGFSRPVTRGLLVGNRFKITIDTKADLGEEIGRCFEDCRARRIGNFFGYQRFGLRGGVNRKVGRAIISKDFASAVELLLAEARDGEDEQTKEARRLCKEGRYKEALSLFSGRQDVERRVASHLSLKPADYLGAIRRIPMPVRKLLVNAFQAFLFNLALSRVVEDGIDVSTSESGDNWASLAENGLTIGKVHGVKEDLPKSNQAVPLMQIVGYAYRNYGSRFDERLAAVLKEQGVEPASFYVKEAEEMSSEGGFRAAPLLASGLSFTKAERGFVLEFTLNKGEYATILLRELLKPGEPLALGF